MLGFGNIKALRLVGTKVGECFASLKGMRGLPALFSDVQQNPEEVFLSKRPYPAEPQPKSPVDRSQTLLNHLSVLGYEMLLY